jgi:hypothetical protein
MLGLTVRRRKIRRILAQERCHRPPGSRPSRCPESRAPAKGRPGSSCAAPTAAGLEVKRIRSPSPTAARSRTFTRATSTAPIPVWIVRAGPWPCRTRRSRPSASLKSFIAAETHRLPSRNARTPVTYFTGCKKLYRSTFGQGGVPVFWPNAAPSPDCVCIGWMNADPRWPDLLRSAQSASRAAPSTQRPACISHPPRSPGSQDQPVIVPCRSSLSRNSIVSIRSSLRSRCTS